MLFTQGNYVGLGPDNRDTRIAPAGGHMSAAQGDRPLQGAHAQLLLLQREEGLPGL